MVGRTRDRRKTNGYRHHYEVKDFIDLFGVVTVNLVARDPGPEPVSSFVRPQTTETKVDPLTEDMMSRDRRVNP